jgi:hypothetical protein
MPRQHDALPPTAVPTEDQLPGIWQWRLEAFKPGRSVLVRESELLALVEGNETVKHRATRTAASRLPPSG